MSTRPIVRSLCLIVAGVMMAFSAGPALAQDWFLHPYGELRAYHGDWLAVCDEGGAGACRAVQIMLEPGETRVGPARLALERKDAGHFDVVFHHQALIAGVRAPLLLDIDGDVLTLSPGQGAPGEPGRPNVIAATLAPRSPRCVTPEALAEGRGQAAARCGCSLKRATVASSSMRCAHSAQRPQQVATLSLLWRHSMEYAPSSQAARIWPSVTLLQTQTYMAG